MDEVVEQRQPPRRLCAVDVPAVAGVNKRDVKRDPQQHQPGADAIEKIFTLYRSIIHTISLHSQTNRLITQRDNV